MEQVWQIAGAILVLIGFALSQGRWLSPHSYPYLLLNLSGSAILAVLAALDKQWGFLLLEGVWAIVSTVGLIARWRGTRKPIL